MRAVDLAVLLETLNADYTFDARGRLWTRRDGGVPPRFMLGRAREGCVWRIRHDVSDSIVARVARLAGREPGAAFDGELPAPPDRLRPIETLFSEPASGPDPEREPAAGGMPSAHGPTARRVFVTRDGVTLGDCWVIE